LAQDQGGCRFLQEKIQQNDPDVVETIFHATIHKFSELMNDPFGNYFTQKLVGVVTRQ
jgi:hypothetical protein